MVAVSPPFYRSAFALRGDSGLAQRHRVGALGHLADVLFIRDMLGQILWLSDGRDLPGGAVAVGVSVSVLARALARFGAVREREIEKGSGAVAPTDERRVMTNKEIAEYFSDYDFPVVARALGKLHSEEKLWQDSRGRACLRTSHFAAKAPV